MTVVVGCRIWRMTSALRLAVHRCFSPISSLLVHYTWSERRGGHYTRSLYLVRTKRGDIIFTTSLLISIPCSMTCTLNPIPFIGILGLFTWARFVSSKLAPSALPVLLFPPSVLAHHHQTWSSLLPSAKRVFLRAPCAFPGSIPKDLGNQASL